MTLASGYGLVADDWQADPVCCILARRKNGRWAAATTKITVPRQNGKNGILEIVELFGMVVLGLKFLHTAHEVKTARKAFRRISSFFENERQYPELASMVREIRKTNGQEAILLKCRPCLDGGVEKCTHDSGGSVEFIARSSGSGRGFTVDVLVCDEDQDLTDDEQAALLPTISAAPSGNPMVILTGTPPDPEKLDASKGEVARRVRADAIHDRDPDLCCFDWGVPDGPMPDVDDESIAASTNPALGGRLNIAEVRRERRMMSPEKFARERYGWWGNPETKHRGVIDLHVWATLKSDAPEPTRATMVIDVSPNLEWATIALGSTAPDGRVLGLVHHKPGTGWAVAKAVEIAGRLQLVGGDKMANEVALTPNAQIFSADLIKAGMKVHLLTNAEIGRGCTALQEWIRQGTVAHVRQPELDAAVRNAATRYVGSTAPTQHWDQRDRSIDMTPLVAYSVAVQRWSALTAKPTAPPPAPRRARRPAAAGAVATVGF